MNNPDLWKAENPFPPHIKYNYNKIYKIMEEKIEVKQLKEALQLTLNMLINVCPSDLAGDKELVNVLKIADEALKIKN